MSAHDTTRRRRNMKALMVKQHFQQRSAIIEMTKPFQKSIMIFRITTHARKVERSQLKANIFIALYICAQMKGLIIPATTPCCCAMTNFRQTRIKIHDLRNNKRAAPLEPRKSETNEQNIQGTDTTSNIFYLKIYLVPWNGALAVSRIRPNDVVVLSFRPPRPLSLRAVYHRPNPSSCILPIYVHLEYFLK